MVIVMVRVIVVVIVIVKAKVMVMVTVIVTVKHQHVAPLMSMVSWSNAGYREVDLQMAAEVRNKMTKIKKKKDKDYV